jgi:hypothetical protein
MRTLTLMLVVAGLALGGAATAAEIPIEGLSTGRAMPPVPAKPAGNLPPPPEVPRVQGDTVWDPFVIASLPFSTSGSTCGFSNDYDYACPYTGSPSPDVVYRWTATDGNLLINLCDSTYDTKVYVYEGGVGVPIACNDDYCAYQSYLENIPVTPGQDYYIVVDGYGGSCGSYYLYVDLYLCSGWVECPAGGVPEGEPDCYEGYVDNYNGGCNSSPFPVFQVLEPSADPIVICGRTGSFDFGTFTYRDTDWFQLDLTAPAGICLAGDCGIPAFFYILDGREGCPGSEIVAAASVGPCDPMSGLCAYCDPGTWWVWVGPADSGLWGCGHPYWMEITGYVPDPSSVPEAGLDRETTWGRVKGLFR